MTHTKQELDTLAKDLVQSSANAQAFADLFSDDDNWGRVDKSINVPRDVAVCEEECPECGKTIRTLHAKFCTTDQHYSLTCPHCKERTGCHLTYEGYTCALTLEPYDEDTHGT